MLYQVIKHNKTSSKVLGMYKTLNEAQDSIKSIGAEFNELSYMGSFPTYLKAGRLYSIQGYAERFGFVCSIPEAELATIK